MNIAKKLLIIEANCAEGKVKDFAIDVEEALIKLGVSEDDVQSIYEPPVSTALNKMMNMDPADAAKEIFKKYFS